MMAKLERSPQPARMEAVSRDALVQAALQEITQNYREASLSNVARAYGVSLAYVSECVRAQTGKTYKELLQKHRMETAARLLDENYIQHNLAYGTGEDAFISSVEGLSAVETATTVENIRAFEDGDYVFLQNVYNFAGAGEQVAFTSSASTQTARSPSTGMRWRPSPTRAPGRTATSSSETLSKPNIFGAG